MKNFYTLISIGLLSINALGQTPFWLWAKRAGSAQYDYSKTVTCDNQGHIYIAGGFGTGTLIFGNDTLVNTSSNAFDAYLTKYDSLGNVIWAKKTTESVNDDFINSITTDSIGNIYATGYFDSDSIRFGSYTLYSYNSSNYGDVFVVKYDSNGNVIWAKSAGGDYIDQAQGISIDKYGNIYIAGFYYSTTITFGAYTLNGFSSFSSAFISKYDTNGNVLYAIKLASSSQASAIDVDNKGNINCTGLFPGNNLLLGNISLNGNCQVGGCYNYFVVQYDSAFTVKWAKTAGGTGNGQDAGNAVCHDSKGNVIVTGSFWGATMVFDTYTLQNNNGASFFGDDAFAVSYDSLGNVNWASRIGSNSYDTGYGVTTDEDDDIYLTGVADALSLSFGTTSQAGNFYGGYVIKCNQYGTLQWIKPNYGEGKSIATGNNKSIFVTGNFDFSPALFDTIILTNAPNNNMDIYLARLDSSATQGVFTDINSYMDNEYAIIIYPNPITTEFNIKINNNEVNEIILYDLSSRKLLFQSFVNTTTINTEYLAKGMYFYEVRNKNRVIKSGKVVKQ